MRRLVRLALVVAIGVLLRLLDLLLRKRGVKRTYALLQRTSPGGGRRRVTALRARRIAVIVERSARRLHDSTSNVTCLRQALATWWLCRWAGVDLEFHLGFRSAGEGSVGHAWVSREGQVINDDPGIADRYPFQVGGDLAVATTSHDQP